VTWCVLHHWTRDWDTKNVLQYFLDPRLWEKGPFTDPQLAFNITARGSISRIIRVHTPTLGHSLVPQLSSNWTFPCPLVIACVHYISSRRQKDYTYFVYRFCDVVLQEEGSLWIRNKPISREGCDAKQMMGCCRTTRIHRTSLTRWFLGSTSKCITRSCYAFMGYNEKKRDSVSVRKCARYHV
jgi:hypothetical protein